MSDRQLRPVEIASELVELQRRISALEAGVKRNDADLTQLKKKHPRLRSIEA